MFLGHDTATEEAPRVFS